MNAALIGLIVYLIAQFLIAAWVFKKISSTRSYFVADRSLGPSLAMFSLFATWFGAETCIGAAGVIYSDGLSGGRADPFGYALCLLLTGLFISARIWKGNYLTIGDLLREKFNSKVEKLASLIVAMSSIFWAAAQIRAFSQVLSVVSGFEFEYSMFLAAFVVIAYTAFGGLLADVITDLIQGLVLSAGLIFLGVMIWIDHGSPVATVLAQSSERLSLVAKGESFLAALDSWCIPVLGSLYAQEIFARVMAARSEVIAKKAAFRAFGWYLLVGSIPVWIGLLGPSIFPGLSNPEQILPMMAKSILPNVFFVLFAGALVSAILSTVDSTLLSAGSLLSQNLFRSFQDSLSENSQLIFARICVTTCGVVAYIFAAKSHRIYDLVEEASSFGMSGFFIVMTLAIFSRRLSSIAAFTTLVVGVISTMIGQNIGLEAPMVSSIVLSGLTYGIIYWVEKMMIAPKPVALS